MRPVRLLLDGFGSYREPAEADFTDVDFFALVGPTGAGKSTVIDGLCFALYGTVPRWGKENVIAQALAPAANACRVCLVFEAAGKRYAAVRALIRDKRGLVHTKEARLELLDASVPPDAPLADLLAASTQALAEGPDQVKAQVQDILGLTYEHFIQSVLLPQGRFADFLHAKAADRQGLLVELLAFGIYNTVGQRARERAKLAAERLRSAQSARDELAGATEEAQASAAEAVAGLAGLAGTVEERLRALADLTGQAERAALEVAECRAAARLLAAVRAPSDVPGLALRIAEADQQVAAGKAERDAADHAETAAVRARDPLGDKTRLELLARSYGDRRDLEAQLDSQTSEHAARVSDQAARAEDLAASAGLLRQAREDQAKAEQSHAAAALAQHLHVGEGCPVCLRPVTALPDRQVPADLAATAGAVRSAEERLSAAQAAHDQVAKAAAKAASAMEGTQQRIDGLRATLADAPGEAEVAAALDAITWADAGLAKAQAQARSRRAALDEAERRRSSLSEEEARAWAGLRRSRDSVVALGAPEIANADLAAQWAALADWARGEQAERDRRQPQLDAVAVSLRQEAASAERALTGLLGEHGITDVTDPARAAVAVARHAERAANRLAAVREARQKAARLDGQIQRCKEETQVASALGQLLRATSFERWLCGEALDSLVIEASETLMELSGGQYQLDRDDRNELVVIDYQDAGAKRPVHTLSGGETFQASLALALALSRQVIGLSGGKRDLNSMFLDEGFGTLDADTLETVGTTLERLAADSDRMIGIVTHVPALAERVPVRFVVSRTGSTSALRREQA